MRKPSPTFTKTYKITIIQEDIDFAVEQLHQVQTQGLEAIIQELCAKEHQVFIIGGTALGSHIIPLFVENHGISRENIYSGYFNGFEEDEIMKALLSDFRYITHMTHIMLPPSLKRKANSSRYYAHKAKLKTESSI